MGVGGEYRKSTPPQKQLKRKWKIGNPATVTKLKREKERRKGLNSIKTVNKESTESTTLQLDTWWCSGGKGEFPGAVWGPGGSWATQGKAVPLLEGHLVETVEVTWSQQTPENCHICWYWNKVVKGEAWCQMCVVIFHNP